MIRGTAEPCSFRGKGYLRVVIHVDDPIACGSGLELDTFWTELAKHVLIRPCGKLEKDEVVTYLGREYRRVETDTDIGFSVRHSQKYLDSCSRVYSFNERTKVKASQVRVETFDNDEEKLESVEHTMFRSGTGKLQFMGADRLELKLPTKNLAHHLAAPSHKDERDSKHVLRCLQGTREDYLFLKIKNAMIHSIRAGDFFLGRVHQLRLGRKLRQQIVYDVCIHVCGRLPVWNPLYVHRIR